MKKHLNRCRGFFIALMLGVAIMLPSFSIGVQAVEKPSVIVGNTEGVDQLLEDVNNLSSKLGKFTFLTKKETKVGGKYQSSTVNSSNISDKHTDSSSKSDGKDKSEDGSKKEDEDSKTTETTTIEGVERDGYIIYINKVDYNNLDSSDKRKLMSETLTAIQECSMQAKERTRLYNFVCDQDTATSAVVRQLSENVKADYVTAWTWFKPFSGVTGTLLGFLAICISVFFTVSTVIDLVFMTIPVMQSAMSTTTGEKPKWVSNEAWTSIKDSERDRDIYRGVLGIYFKRRAKAIVMLGLCLAYLLNGQIFQLVGWLMDTISTVIFD